MGPVQVPVRLGMAAAVAAARVCAGGAGGAAAGADAVHPQTTTARMMTRRKYVIFMPRIWSGKGDKSGRFSRSVAGSWCRNNGGGDVVFVRHAGYRL